MNYNDVQKQLQHMIAFIEQEANEKAEEIDAKADEEYSIEKGRLVQQQRTKINEYYDKKLKQVALQKKIQGSQMFNEGRLQVLRAREEYLNGVIDEARNQLTNITASDKYEDILEGLIKQALFQLLENEVTLKCRENDLSLVNKILPKCVEDLNRQWDEKCTVNIDTKNFLPSTSAGGVEASAKNGKIIVVSTLESRLNLIANQITPQLRTALFGPNLSRTHFD